jgi:hypothetical protein
VEEVPQLVLMETQELDNLELDDLELAALAEAWRVKNF